MHEPESLEELLVIVTPRSLWTLISLIGVLIIVIAWGVFSRIPVTVDGFGILVKPGTIKTIQAMGSGTLFSIDGQIGDTIDAGEIIATLNEPDQLRQLNTDIARYNAKQEFNQNTFAIAQKKRNLEISLVNSTIDALKKETQSIDTLREKLEKKTKSNVKDEADSLEKNQRLLDDLFQSQKKQLEAVSQLIEEGAASDSQRLQMQATLTDTERRISELNMRRNNTEVRLLDTEQQDIRFDQELTQLNSRLQQELIRREKINQDFQIEEHRKNMELTELASSIRLTKERHFRQQNLYSTYPGKILEISSSVGESLKSGGRLAIIQADPSSTFKRIVFGEDVAKGKFSLVFDGRVTEEISFPTTNKIISNNLEKIGFREKFGNFEVITRQTGRSFDVILDNSNEFSLQIKDEKLFSEENIPSYALILNLGGEISDLELRHLCFFAIGDGKKVLKGMKIRMSPSNVERQRFGSIVGRVTSVSDYPVTSEGVLSLTGNKEVATALLEKGGTILVDATLNKKQDDPTKYQWTSKGYDGEITAGTTTTCRITVEERPPVTFVVPLLRKWLLGEANNAPPV